MKKKDDAVVVVHSEKVHDERQVPVYLGDSFRELVRDRVGVQGLLQYAERRFRELGVMGEAIWNKIFLECGVTRGTDDRWEYDQQHNVIRLVKKAAPKK